MMKTDSLPQHIALVMDGNGRWATQRGLPRTEGHRRGGEALMDVIEGCLELGIPYLSCFGFSTENWKRSESEVNFILSFFGRAISRKRRDYLHKRGVQIRWSGQRERLPGEVIAELKKSEQLTAENTAMTVVLCFNYGARAEIAAAAASIAREVAAGQVEPDAVDEEMVARHLILPDIPDVDLFIRTSGEQRISNFLLWQSAYAELVFCDTLFPDFSRKDLRDVVEIYSQRQRRFGGV